jgi:SH3-like domain-containing protein
MLPKIKMPLRLLPLLRMGVLGLASLGAFQVVHGAEFRSVSVAAAVLWDGPSDKAKKVFVAPRGMPVELVSTLNTWMKVRDVAGDVSWVAGADLSKTRTVLATTLATVRTAAQDSAPLAFQAERGVTLELLGAGQVTAGFVHVKHKDGTTGFVKTSEVWGL